MGDHPSRGIYSTTPTPASSKSAQFQPSTLLSPTTTQHLPCTFSKILLSLTKDNDNNDAAHTTLTTASYPSRLKLVLTKRRRLLTEHLTFKLTRLKKLLDDKQRVDGSEMTVTKRNDVLQSLNFGILSVVMNLYAIVKNLKEVVDTMRNNKEVWDDVKLDYSLEVVDRANSIGATIPKITERHDVPAGEKARGDEQSPQPAGRRTRALDPPTSQTSETWYGSFHRAGINPRRRSLRPGENEQPLQSGSYYSHATTVCPSRNDVCVESTAIIPSTRSTSEGIQTRTWYGSKPVDICRVPIAPWKHQVTRTAQWAPARVTHNDSASTIANGQKGYAHGYNTFRVEHPGSSSIVALETSSKESYDQKEKALVTGFQKRTYHMFRKLPKATTPPKPS